MPNPPLEPTAAGSWRAPCGRLNLPVAVQRHDVRSERSVAKDHAIDALDSFLSLEGRFRDFLRAVTFKKEHLKVHSPMLTSILLDAGSLSESVLKSGMDNARYNSRPNIASIRAKRYTTNPPYYTLNDSRTVYRRDQFYAKKIWFLPRSDSSFPWHSWQKATGSHPS